MPRESKSKPDRIALWGYAHMPLWSRRLTAFVPLVLACAWYALVAGYEEFLSTWKDTWR